MYDIYQAKLAIYSQKKAAGYKNLKKPKPPNYGVFSQMYRVALEHSRKD
jgi:hypothetical protein